VNTGFDFGLSASHDCKTETALILLMSRRRLLIF